MLKTKRSQTVQGLFVLHLAERQHCRFRYFQCQAGFVFVFLGVFCGRRLNTQGRVKNI